MTDDIAPQLAELEAELGRLSDLEAIYRLRLTYYVLVNDGRFADIAALFAEDAIVDFGNELGIHAGRGAIAAAFGRLRGDGFIKLLSHGHVADVAGDSATGSLFFEGRLIVAGESYITMGKVADSYARIDGAWRIAGTVTTYYYATPLQVGWAVDQPVRPITCP